MTNAYIERALLAKLPNLVKPGKVLKVLGARRVGKTELLRKYISTFGEDTYLFLNGEDLLVSEVFRDRSFQSYKRLLGDRKLLVIDEAQHITDIGLNLKFLVDSFPDVAVIATGSSLFDLENKLGEPLVGRGTTVYMHSVSQLELSRTESYLDTKATLEEKLIYGSYPEVLTIENNSYKEAYLRELVSSYLMKDILQYEGIRKSEKIISLLKLLALQAGSEVNLEELASNLKGISRNTVENYLDLLSKVFVIHKLGGFSRNLRKEITKSSKWYFYDNGVRNALLNDFSPLNLRSDTGLLWESYLMNERMKYLSYSDRFVNRYFWRTYDQQEIDLIEEESGELRAIELKWKSSGKIKPPGGWTTAYEKAQFHIIDQDNYLDFIASAI